MTKGRRRAPPAGFSLIEVVLAVALISLLVGGVYAIARGAVQVSGKVVRNQQQSMNVHSFIELCRRNFEAMQGNAKVELITEGLSGSARSELVFTDYPMGFTWSGVPAGSAAVIMRTDRTSSGAYRVSLQYLDEEQNEQRQSALAPADLGVTLPLLDDIRSLQWRFWDARTEEWEEVWEDANLRPSLVELNVEFLDGDEPLRSVFWIPTMANPETLAQAGRAEAGQGGGPGGPGGPGGGPGAGGDAPGGDFQLPNDPEGRRRALQDMRERRQGRGGGGQQRGGGGGGAPR
jgi:prepilin-type N-terminal cleavage/methylation domain-containing protein